VVVEMVVATVKKPMTRVDMSSWWYGKEIGDGGDAVPSLLGAKVVVALAVVRELSVC
jgi:hypothetical protein